MSEVNNEDLQVLEDVEYWKFMMLAFIKDFRRAPCEEEWGLIVKCGLFFQEETFYE